MSKTYKDCPTCGGLAYYTGENFKRAEVLISAENEHLKQEIKLLVKELVQLESVITGWTNELNSVQLRFLYQFILRKELMAKQLETDKIYGDAHNEQQKAWNEYLKTLKF